MLTALRRRAGATISSASLSVPLVTAVLEASGEHVVRLGVEVFIVRIDEPLLGLTGAVTVVFILAICTVVTPETHGT